LATSKRLSLVCLVGQLIGEKPIKGFKFSLSFVEVARRGLEWEVMEFWAYFPMTLTEFGLLAGLLVPGSCSLDFGDGEFCQRGLKTNRDTDESVSIFLG